MIANNQTELDSLLKRVDWDFPRASTPASTVHSLHWFPGNFIPQIPSFLIQLLSRPGETILDPFCGSGTTLVEALALGRKAVGRDINRASVHVATGKLSFCTQPSIKSALESTKNELLLELQLLKASVSIPRAGLLDWFHRDTLRQLQSIWEVIQKCSDVRAAAALELIFTDVLFTCAAPGARLTRNLKVRKHHWGWIADNVKPSEKRIHDAVQLFLDRLNRAVALLTSKALYTPEATVSRCDARALDLPDASVDVVVTSPPYLGMIDYTLANRLTYMWMGWPMDDDIKLELGARRYRNRPNVEAEYLDAMKMIGTELRRVIRPGGKLAILLGTSRKFPDAACSTFRILEDFFNPLWGPQARTPTRRRVSDRGGNAPNEFLYVYERA